MNQTDLDRILKSHKLWLAGDPSGERANLTGANLAGANLAGADLTGADLSGANLTEAVVRIGNRSAVLA